MTVTLTVASELKKSSLAKNVKLSEPLKLAFGIYIAVEPETETLPFEASPPKLNVRISPSISLPDKSTLIFESSSPVALAASATGASLTGLTVTSNESCTLNLLTTSLAYTVTEPDPF